LADSYRSQNAIWPNYLGLPASSAVLSLLLSQPLFRQYSMAPQAMPTGNGKSHLTGYSITGRDLMDIHADIDIRNQETPAELLKLIPGRKAVHAANHDVASPQQVAAFLPASNDLNVRIWIDSENKFPDHIVLGTLQLGICRATAHHAIEVWVLDVIKICSDEPADADVSQLLAYMRATAAKADNANPGLG
jgi:hypothetical protein